MEIARFRMRRRNRRQRQRSTDNEEEAHRRVFVEGGRYCGEEEQDGGLSHFDKVARGIEVFFGG
jgi:hypothetical protein